MTRDLAREAEGWARLASPLSDFVFGTLPNRTDVWGGYVHPNDRETWGKVLTAPAKRSRGKRTLSPSVLERHFRASHGGDVIGLHTTSPSNTSRWGGMDFDVHSDDGEIPAEHRHRVQQAFAYCATAMATAGPVLLEDSDGDGGRHIWIRFTEPVPTSHLFVWLTTIAEDCHRATSYRPETFPKQPRLELNNRKEQKVGNWLRLPGRHHTRSHWSRLAEVGGRWQSGAEAAALLLAWSSTPATVIPAASVPVVTKRPTTVGLSLSPTGLSNRALEIARFVAKLPVGGDGSGRSDRLYKLAAFLVHDMRCTDDEALPVLRAWNSGNTPPLSEAKVIGTWENAVAYGGRRVA
ncbi:TOTE conflict system archaeo-eukaryotic primase domain-containing protein [Gemmatimonas sp.]|uniref:TOTE conflict system archaeo-eukaryotic primase domain-containing protein n=1 Tax=Gemmatimonas sp. TaxID=1962908 RepID=UPI003DA4E697